MSGSLSGAGGKCSFIFIHSVYVVISMTEKFVFFVHLKKILQLDVVTRNYVLKHGIAWNCNHEIHRRKLQFHVVVYALVQTA